MDVPKDTRVLVVEDEYLVAREICDMVEDIGLTVVGPAPSAERAEGLLDRERADVALLDINLSGRMVYPLIAYLRDRHIPCILVTGYDGWAVEPDFRNLERLEKPFRRRALEGALERAFATA